MSVRMVLERKNDMSFDRNIHESQSVNDLVYPISNQSTELDVEIPSRRSQPKGHQVR